MVDIKQLRDNLEHVIERLNTRGDDFSYLREVVSADKERREIIKELEMLKHSRNAESKKIGAMKRQGKDVTPVLEKIESDKAKIQALQNKKRLIEENIQETLLKTPNLPHQAIPIGKDENDNVLLREVGTIEPKDFEVKPHYEIAQDLDILDFERAAKVATSRFVIYKNAGAHLERALINFMLDLHRENGYEELLLPYITNYESMLAAGQFPKFEADAFKLVDERNLYLNPTAEVPSINYHRDEILEAEALPKKYAAFTTAFRQEAGSAGRDTRGIIRLHQFNKVELIKFATPETSYEELDDMLASSEAVLQRLNLPYRVIELCSGDIGFAMAKTYDIEVYIPSQNTYREIGSISNAEDYQARRGNIKFRREADGKPEFVHTLNGSGLAVGRTVVAIIENYQQKDGSIIIPEALRPYMHMEKIQ